MAKRRRDLPALSDAEWEVMKVVWDREPLAAREVFAGLSHTRWSHTTVKTLLGRIVQKGWLDYDRVGNSFLYRSAVARERATSAALGKFTENILAGSLSPFVAYFAKKNKLTPEDIEEIEEIIRDYRSKKGGGQ